MDSSFLPLKYKDTRISIPISKQKKVKKKIFDKELKKIEKDITFVKLRRKVNENDYDIGKIQRRDILMKATLRKIRRYFKERFSKIKKPKTPRK